MPFRGKTVGLPGGASCRCERIGSMSNTQGSSSHGKLIAVVVAAAVVIILAVLSAFVWPGWAIRHDDRSEEHTSELQSP